MTKFTSYSPPQISASLHQSDFAPYVSGSYNAQWNAPELSYDKHMSHWSCILWEMKVEESLMGSQLPLHYRADTGVSQHTTLELG